ncbi:carotenoid biosynthesis protein [candidate division KSB1 bacterium]|nr:carotenoid biosynthesis protein [candidate division KSB1 bacterium]
MERPGRYIQVIKKEKSFINNKISIFILYFLLCAGALWHILGLFQELMRIVASPLLLLLGFVLWYLIFNEYYQQGYNKSKYFFLIWSLAVVTLSIFFEFVGVKTGLIFGQYYYGNVLQPQLFEVPLAIGFAWLGILLSSLALLKNFFDNKSFFLMAAGVALLMTLFDLIMEPAATYVDYWYWQNDHAPLLNYLSWFILGFVFAVTGKWTGLYKIKLPAFVYHAYIAQFLYFLLIDLKYLL